MSERKKAALHNLGCKVNAYETEAMQELLEKNGYEIVPFHDLADVYVINTCSVTNMADRKSRQMIHRARKQNPDAVIVAAGCYVQAQADMGELDESRAYKGISESAGWLQPVLYLLHHSLCERTRAQQEKGRCSGRGAYTCGTWVSGSGAYRNPSQFLRIGMER